MYTYRNSQEKSKPNKEMNPNKVKKKKKKGKQSYQAKKILGKSSGY